MIIIRKKYIYKSTKRVMNQSNFEDNLIGREDEKYYKEHIDKIYSKLWTKIWDRRKT